MLTFSDDQVLAWLTPLIWPFIRTLSLFSTLPVFGQRTVPTRVRIALSFLIVLCAQASLPPIAPVGLDTPMAVIVLLQQVLIGVTLGFAVQIVFTGVSFAGELIGLQMGLNFAGFFNPMSQGNVTATSSLFTTLVSWLFVVTGGHLLVVAALIKSFTAFPVGPEPLAFLHAVAPQVWGAEIFRLGLWIAMPILTMLLFVNMVLGIISRVAQQMNVFAIGFPITIGVGLLGLMVTLPTLQTPFVMALERMLELFQ